MHKLVTLAVFICFGSHSVLAQHATAFDVVNGEQAYQTVCANCHGVAGNLIANVDLGHGTFRQPYTDDELLEIVLKGIPGTPMPGNPNMAREQALEVVAYLRSRGNQVDAALGGDPVRGRALFAGKGACLDCHRIAGKGGRIGPELTRIGLLRTSGELLTSLLEPDLEVQANARFYTVLTRDSERVNGRLLNHDAFTVQLLDTREELRSFVKADLQEANFIASPMPSLRGTFDSTELADLVQYLVSLRGETP